MVTIKFTKPTYETNIVTMYDPYLGRHEFHPHQDPVRPLSRAVDVGLGHLSHDVGHDVGRRGPRAAVPLLGVLINRFTTGSQYQFIQSVWRDFMKMLPTLACIVIAVQYGSGSIIS